MGISLSQRLELRPQQTRNRLHEAARGNQNLRKETKQMTYESFDLVELGKAEVAIEIGLPQAPEETENDKFTLSVAPYVEYDE